MKHTPNIVETLLKKNQGMKITTYDFEYPGCDRELFWGYGEKNQWFVSRSRRYGERLETSTPIGFIYIGSDFAEAVRHMSLKKE